MAWAGRYTIKLQTRIILKIHFINEEERFTPHGYAVLSFNGPDLIEQILTPDAVVIHEKKVS